MEQVIRRGQIYLMNFGKHHGSVQYGVRPGIVIQNNVGNKYSSTIVSVPITGKIKRLHMPTHVLIRSVHGLDCNSMALCEQSAPIDKSMLISYIGELAPREMMKVEKAVAINLGFDKKYNIMGERIGRDNN